ncbi:hypothetical protein [Plantibacter sp. YIM 135249]|uniref:hypothetical protein n=1 Tax=Plantibacter sp. YIM 135249 TaxID=3423918 RepID=UPI003D3455C7
MNVYVVRDRATGSVIQTTTSDADALWWTQEGRADVFAVLVVPATEWTPPADPEPTDSEAN